MFNLHLSGKGQSLAGLPNSSGPSFEIAHLYSGIPASGNYKFVRVRLADESCTMEWATGSLTIVPSVSTLPKHAVNPTFTTLYGLIVTRAGDAGAVGSLVDTWFNGADAPEITVPAAGFLYAHWNPAGIVFPTTMLEISTGNDGTVDVLIIGK